MTNLTRCGKRSDHARHVGHIFVRAAQCGIVALAALVSTIGLVLGAGAAPVQAPVVPPSPTQMTSGTNSAATDFAACLANQHRGQLMILMDTSGSIQKTDPSDSRIHATDFLLDELAQQAAQGHFTLEVGVAGFSTGYTLDQSWTDLSASGVANVKAAVAHFAQDDSGFDTNYWSALQGARQALLTRAIADQETTPCQSILWVTDGQYEIDARTTAEEQQLYGTTEPFAPGIKVITPAAASQAQAEGLTSMCRAGGLVDQIRAGGIKVFAIGLEASGTTGHFALMKEIASGGSCGTLDQTSPGEFQTAGNIDDLVFALSHDLGGPNDRYQAKGVCGATSCALGTYPIYLDDSIDAVQILAGSSQVGVEVELRSPTGSATTFADKAGSGPAHLIAGSQPVTATWLSPRTLSLNLRRSATTSWVGQWQVLFLDPAGAAPGATSRTDVHVDGDLEPAWLNEHSVTLRSAGIARGLRFGVTRIGSNVPLVLSAVQSHLSLTVSLVVGGSSTVVAAEASNHAISRSVSLDLRHVPSGPATLRLDLATTTSGAPATATVSAVPGTRLTDQIIDLPIAVLTPLSYPTLQPPRLQFKTGTGLEPLTATLTVHGPGCVWSGTSTFDALPDGMSPIRLSSPYASPSHCLQVAKGNVATLPVTMRVGAVGNGTVGGNLEVRLAPIGAKSSAVGEEVPFLAQYQRPVNAGIRLAVLLLALLVGLGLPIALFYLFRYRATALPGQSLLLVVTPVIVARDVVTQDGRPLAETDADLVHAPLVTVPRGARSVALSADGLPVGTSLSVRLGWAPIDFGAIEIEAPLASVSAHGRRGSRARLPLDLRDAWFALVVQNSRTRAAVLVVLLPADARQNDWRRVAGDVARALPDLVALEFPFSPPDEETKSGSLLDGLISQDPSGSPHLGDY